MAMSIKKTQNNYIRLLQMAMLTLNILVVMGIVIFIYVTNKNINDHYGAKAFLSVAEAIPIRPMQNIFLCAALLIVIIISFVLTNYDVRSKTQYIIVSLICEFIASFLIIFILNFNYNGIILFVFMNLATYSKGNKIKSFLMVLALICFIATGFDFMQLNWKLYDLQNYIIWYPSNVQQYLLIAYNGLTSLNILLFVLCCTYQISSQRDTIKEVNDLYAQLSKVNYNLEQANEQLREYAVITEKLGETKERNRLAREIHDTLGHTLTGILAGIDACITTLHVKPELTKKQLELIADAAREGIKDVRGSVSRLRVDSENKLSLEHSIINMIINIQNVSDVKVYFTNQAGNLHFNEDKENAIYRVIQESLTNAIRHGKAKKIWVEITSNSDYLYLSIVDNGQGCNHIYSGFGTRHIKERLEMLGGGVEFNGENGFSVKGKIPIRKREDISD